MAPNPLQRRFFASRRAVSLAALSCIALMLVAANIIAARFLAVRADLTAERLYTLAHGTRQTLAKIDEPITLRFYYSSRLGEAIPAYGLYAGRVRELFEQYVAAAGPKLRLETYDPQPFSDVEDRAVAFGLQGVPLSAQGEQVYFGLAGTNSTDDQQVIPFFAPEREPFLEYDVTRLVRALAAPQKIVVGLMTSLPLDGDPRAAMAGRPSEPMGVITQLRQLDTVEPLAPNIPAIPPRIDVLMLAHPQNLPEPTLFAIDQFVLGGGKALIFVDPYSELQARLRGRTNSLASANASNLGRLFQRWGLRLVPDVVAGDRRNARRVVVPAPGRGTEAIDYIAWLSLHRANFSHDNVMTADLGSITMATAGILEPIAGAATKFEPLIETSPDATRIPVDEVRGLPDVSGLLARFKPDNQEYILAAEVTGNADTAFPDGPPKPAAKPAASSPEPAPPAAAWIKRSAQPIEVVIVADTDILDDRSWVQSRNFFGRQTIVPLANNGDFVANAVEVLAGGSDLVDLRGRGSSARPFERIESIQRAADQRYAAEQQSLQKKLAETQGELRRLTGAAPAAATTATPVPPSAEESKAIDQFRAELLATRRQLRAVQAALRRDIRRLQAIIEFCDIALVPMVVAAAAIGIATLRLRRRYRRLGRAAG